ncbi:MAG: ABC transporter substrate-binding protein [Gallionella sp.]|jgi:phospholipid transport system substrate-binding protein
MKKITGFIVGATLFCALSTAQADVIAPDALIKNTVQDVVTIIKQDKEIQSGNERKIAALVDAKVVPHFDFVRMTQLAIGKNWRSATPAQKEALVTGFRNMLVRTYTKVFTVYRDQAIDVKPLKMSADDSEVTVKTTISKPGTQSIPVDYEMKKAADGWKVFDISIEGVSMVLSYRGTFTSQIQQNGIDGLIKTLSDPADDAVKAKAK